MCIDRLKQSLFVDNDKKCSAVIESINHLDPKKNKDFFFG